MTVFNNLSCYKDIKRIEELSHKHSIVCGDFLKIQKAEQVSKTEKQPLMRNTLCSTRHDNNP